MNVQMFAATALATAIADRVQLGSQPTVVDAPPSQVAEYPTIAVQIEKSTENYSMAFPVLVNDSGALIAGTNATDEDGDVVDGTVVQLGDGVTATSIGTLRCSGRLWVGSRYPDKREEIAWAVTFAFNQEDASPGRLMISLNGASIAGRLLRFGFAAADLGDTAWQGEYAFSARLWAWRTFTLDIPIYVTRTDPIVTRMILEFSRDLTARVEQPSDVAGLTDLEKYIVSQGGDITITTL